MFYAYIPDEASTVMQYVRLDYIPVVSHSVGIDHTTSPFNSQSSSSPQLRQHNDKINSTTYKTTYQIIHISKKNHSSGNISQVHVPSSQDKTKQSSKNNRNKLNPHEQKCMHLQHQTIIQSRFPITQNPYNN